MNFYEQENNKTVLKTREIIRELPEFCNEFFLDLNQNTLPKTRMGYAYDLRVFFNFLVTENKEFLGRDIKSLTLDDLQKIKVVDLNQFMDYLAYYVSEEDIQMEKMVRQENWQQLESCLSIFIEQKKYLQILLN